MHVELRKHSFQSLKHWLENSRDFVDEFIVICLGVDKCTIDKWHVSSSSRISSNSEAFTSELLGNLEEMLPW